MALQCAIYFAQPGGGGTSSARTALIGTLNHAVTVRNAYDASGPAVRWTFTVVDVPPGSAVPTGVVQDGATDNWVFTPDVSGGYLVQLTVYDASDNAAIDVRAFGVRELSGRMIPPFKGTDDSLNWIDSDLGGQNLKGWAPYQDAYDRAVDALAVGTGGVLTAACVAASNVTLSGLQNLNGVTATEGTVTLAVGQTSGVQNGLWKQHAGAWTRHPSMAAGSPASGAVVVIQNGDSVFGDSSFVCRSSPGSDVVGTNSLSFGVLRSPVITLAYAGTVNIDLARGRCFFIELTGDVTFTVSNLTPDSSLTLLVQQDGVGSHGVTWPAEIAWPNGTPSPLSVGPAGVDAFEFSAATVAFAGLALVPKGVFLSANAIDLIYPVGVFDQTAAPTMVVDWSMGSICRFTLSQAVTLSLPNNPVPNRLYALLVTQGHTGSPRYITYPLGSGGFKFQDQLAITAMTGNGVGPIVCTVTSTARMGSLGTYGQAGATQYVQIAGSTGNTAANQTTVATVINGTQFSIPFTGNGTYTGGAVATLVPNLSPGDDQRDILWFVSDGHTLALLYVGNNW